MSIADVSGKSIAELVSLKAAALLSLRGNRLGKAMVRRLAEAGAAVLIGDIDYELAQATAAELSRSCGATVLPTRLDVADSASIIATADLAVEKFGSLDIWVNNAALYPASRSWRPPTTSGYVMAVNLRGMFVGSREAARRMIAAGHGGVIINVSSQAGFRVSLPGWRLMSRPSMA